MFESLSVFKQELWIEGQDGYLSHFYLSQRKWDLMKQWERIHLPSKRCGFPYVVQEDSLEKKMVTHSSILAWEIPQTEESGGL